MIDAFVKKMINMAVSNGRILEEDIEIYQYGYLLLIEASICAVISLIMALVSNTVIELLVFSIFFIPLRCIGGGFHASKAWKCFIISFGITFLFCMSVSSSIIVDTINILFIGSIMAVILSQQLIKKYKYTDFITSKLICNLINLLGIILVLTLYRTNEVVYAASISIAQLIWFGSLIAKRNN